MWSVHDHVMYLLIINYCINRSSSGIKCAQKGEYTHCIGTFNLLLLQRADLGLGEVHLALHPAENNSVFFNFAAIL